MKEWFCGKCLYIWRAFDPDKCPYCGSYIISELEDDNDED